jgi:putative oxidoreductase
MTRFNTALSRISSLAPLVLRLAIGGLMTYHGFDKLRGGMDGVEAMFTMMDVPAPTLTAPLVTALEIIGGLALVAGIGTRLAAASLAAVLTGALLFVKTDLGIISSGPMPGAELDIALLAGLIALLLLGPGNMSADRAVGLEPVLT